MSRVCMPNCKDIRTDKGYTECCSAALCNGARGGGGALAAKMPGNHWLPERLAASLTVVVVVVLII